ncbi:type IVa pilus pseudopilin TppE [Comamonas humi]
MLIRHCYQHQAATGFTAIELMVVVAILAILAALAGPSFNGLIERWRVRQAVEGLQSALYYARSEAIKRGGSVSLRKEESGTNGCSLAKANDDWDCGWFVFVDTNDNGDRNRGEEILLHVASPARTQITRKDGGAAIIFSRWGTPKQAFGFSLVPQGKSHSDPAARGLCMSSGGRIRITTDPNEIPCSN